MNLDERATKLLEEALPEIPLQGLTYDLQAETIRDQASVEPGELRISTQEFFDVAPVELKMLLHNAANKARRASGDAQAHDSELIESFLAGLRDEPRKL